MHGNSDSYVINYELTDHLPIVVAIPSTKVRPNRNKTYLVRYKSEQNISKFIHELNLYVLDFRIDGCVEGAFNKFIRALYDIYYNCFPLKQVTKKKCSPWINEQLKFFIKKKAKLFKLFLRGSIRKSHYRNYCKVLTAAIRRTKRLYYNCLFRNCRGDSKKTWKLINNLKNKFKADIIESLQVNGVSISDSANISDQFNRFFVNAASNIMNNIPPPTRSYDSLIPMNPNEFVFSPVSSNLINKTVNSFKNKACHVHEIPISILKRIIDVISPTLSLLINLCVHDGVYPSVLKLARVVPIFKAGVKQHTTNYRPISVLPIINKLLETVIHKRMSAFIERYKLLSPNQYGFRVGKSTTCAILNFVTKVITALNNKEYVLAIFLDLCKAFDCVHRPTLIMKLHRYGFRGDFLSFLRSYLDCRMQYTDVNNVKSSPLRINYGVPQGSVLGPLLFIIFINDINFILPQLYKVLFADDTVVLKSGVNFNDLVRQIQDDLNILVDWMNYNKLSINANKTKCIVFSGGKSYDLPRVAVNGSVLQIVKNYNYLGLVIDDRLSFSSHIDYVTGKLNYLRGVLYSLRNYLPRNALLTTYYSLVFQHLLMHIIVWGGACSTHLQSLQIAQNKIARTIIGNRSNYINTSSIFNELDMHQVHKIYKIRVLLFMFKWLVNGNFHFLDSMKEQIYMLHNHNTRTSWHLRLPKPRLDIFKRSAVYRGIMLWNTLSPRLRQEANFSKFKKLIMDENCF